MNEQLLKPKFIVLYELGKGNNYLLVYSIDFLYI